MTPEEFDFLKKLSEDVLEIKPCSKGLLQLRNNAGRTSKQGEGSGTGNDRL